MKSKRKSRPRTRASTKPPRDTRRRDSAVESAPPIVHELFRRAKEKGVSMYMLCARAKVHHDVVGRWRRGVASPNVATLDKLLQALDSF